MPLDAPPSSVLPLPSPAAPLTTPPPQFRRFGDARATRKLIFDNVLSAAQALQPVTNSRHSLALEDVDYTGPEDYSISEQKQAILDGGTLTRRLQGNWVLRDTAGQELSRKKSVVARVPYLTDRGTFIFNGSAYPIAHQLRLRQGTYARRKENGELESHVNVSKGYAHRIAMDPETGVFKLQLGQARIPLLPLLRTMGVGDDQLKEAWGRDLLFANASKEDVKAIPKLFDKLIGDPLIQDNIAKAAAVKAAFEKMELDPEVTKRTLGKEYRNLTADAILDVTRKLLRVNRGEEDPDDRDALPYQKLVGPEDLFAERFKYAPNVMRRILWKAAARGNIDHAPAGAFDDTLNSVLLSSGLSSAAEEVNPAELLDHQTRVTRMGEGGLPSIDAIPDESRGVQPSQFGFVDFLRTSESEKVGVDMRLARGAVKGNDGRLYTQVRDLKTGQLGYKSAQDLADSALGFPGGSRGTDPYVPALQGGRIRMVPRDKVDFEVPHMEDTFSPLGNLIPLKSMVKGQRAVMAARMLTQALPLVAAEAPLVQSGVPGQPDKSFEEEYASHMGAVRSSRGGRVESVGPDGVRILSPDGALEDLPLYSNFPYNRKTFQNNTAVVKPGDMISPGGLVAMSNYTDQKGVTALGKNARVAYVPFDGHSFEDAIVISQAYAKRMTSEHMLQHGYDWDDQTKRGKNTFSGIFAGRYDKKVLDNFGADGVIKPGTEVKYGDPLILAVREREANRKSLLRGRSSFSDASVTWEHDSPGVVTDVSVTDKGANVVVKAQMPMRVGDKLSGRMGDKGIISKIVPDDEMPVGADGQPFEVLANPLGVISRVNPAQIVEAALGKIAAQRGAPYKIQDFGDEEDMVEYALKELQKHGLSDTETVIDPRTGRKIPDVFTGNRWYMKLHHTAESKAGGRGIGSYTAEGSPARGGHEGGGAKRIGMLELGGLLSHGATEVIRGAKLLRGQANPASWVRVMSGQGLPTPEVPFVYKKFVESLKGAGINVLREGPRTHIMPMTDRTIDALSEDRELQNVETVNWKTMAPIPGGLFSEELTGGHPSMQGGGCFAGSVQIWTEHGMIPIGRLVRERMAVNVWSYDFANQQFVLRPITGWFRNYSTEGVGQARLSQPACPGSHLRGSHVRQGFSPRTLTGTRTHQVFNLAGNKLDLAAAGNLVIVTELLTYTQEQLLFGSLLGDGHVSPIGNLSFGHSDKQREYIELLQAVLAPLVSTGIRTSRARLGKKVHTVLQFSTRVHAAFRNARTLCYVGRRKTLSQEWLDRIDVLGLAFWVLDDGSTNRARKKNTITVKMSTECFSLAEMRMLQTWLLQKWGLNTSTTKGKRYSGRDCGWVLKFIGAAAEKLLDLIAPFVPVGMQYKLATRPVTSRCRICAREISRRCDTCNACLLASPYRPNSRTIHSTVWYRFGGTAAVKELLHTATVPPEITGCERWEARLQRAGSAEPAMLQDTALRLSLQTTPCRFIWADRPQWMTLERTLYDIEVADNHNYFANGVLVSNSRWSAIKLHEPLPNPVMEEPIRRILGLTEAKFLDVLAGKERLNGETGPGAISQALANIDLPMALSKARQDIASGKKTKRDEAVRKLGYLKDAERMGIHPKDWMLTKVPVLPPAFRPVSTMGAKKLPLVADSNYLYKELWSANQNLKELSPVVGAEGIGDERLAVYNAFKAVTGLGDPTHPKNVERKVKGILKHVFGNSPKSGVVNRKLLGSQVDLVGRATVAPDPNLDMDQVGLPESTAWSIYAPLTVGRLVRRGMQRREAARAVEERSPAARAALVQEMDEGVVIVNRAPTLHRFGIMAARPRLIKGDVMTVSPLTVGGYGMDFDGDAMNFHALPTDAEKKEALEKMLPSRNLFSVARLNKPIHVPTQEYVAGLYEASARIEKDKPALVFENAAAAIQARREGRIGVGRRVDILRD